MINNANISSYINFLHLKKYNAPAAEELKARWALVPDQDIQEQLTGLYQHWGIDPATASFYEQSFFTSQQQAQHYNAATEQPAYPNYQAQQQPYIPSPSKSKTPWIIAVFFIAAGVLGAAYYMVSKNNGDHPSEPSTANNDTSEKITETKVEPDAPKAVQRVPATASTIYSEGGDEEVSDKDNNSVETIKTLISSEESKNMSGILNSFSPDMEQYWDISYPSQEDLVKRYNSVWTKSADGKHHHVRIDKINDNTYDLYADYEFYSIKDQISKAIHAHVRYVFGDDGKIIKTYGVK